MRPELTVRAPVRRPTVSARTFMALLATGVVLRILALPLPGTGDC